MQGKTRMSTSRSFTIIALVLLLWNLIGVAAFVMQYTADLEALAKSDPYTARIFAGMPGWAWAAYVVAVGAGTLGAVKGAGAAVFPAVILAIAVGQWLYARRCRVKGVLR